MQIICKDKAKRD